MNYLYSSFVCNNFYQVKKNVSNCRAYFEKKVLFISTAMLRLLLFYYMFILHFVLDNLRYQPINELSTGLFVTLETKF